MAAVGLAQDLDSGAVRVPGRPVLWLIALGAVAAAVVSVSFALTSDHQSAPGVQGALMAWITLAYVFAGLVAWYRRRRPPPRREPGRRQDGR